MRTNSSKPNLTPNSTPKLSKMGTIAIVLTQDDNTDHWIDTFSDEKEIRLLETAIQGGESFPLETIYRLREEQDSEEGEFGDYVENLLSNQCARSEVQAHGVAWLKSKIRIEKFKRQEQDAAEVIAQYALAKYRQQPDLTDFVLAGHGVEVRVKIFSVRLNPGANVQSA